MNKYLEQLIELSQIDKEIDSFGPRIEKINKELSSVAKKQNDLTEKKEKLIEEKKDNDLKVRQHELHLAELAQRLQDINKKSGAVKTDKEMKALQLEEDITKEQCDFANEEIQRLQKSSEAKDILILEIDEELIEVVKIVDEKKVQIEAKLKEINEDRKKVYAKRDKILSKINQKILEFYHKVRKWAGNETVVPVKKQACYGCHMRINDKTFSSVIKSEDIVTCPHCGRILYIEDNNEEE